MAKQTITTPKPQPQKAPTTSTPKPVERKNNIPAYQGPPPPPPKK
jgi:hypothetical protein